MRVVLDTCILKLATFPADNKLSVIRHEPDNRLHVRSELLARLSVPAVSTSRSESCTFPAALMWPAAFNSSPVLRRQQT